MNDGQKILYGNEVSEDYVKRYTNSHKNKDIDYRIGYAYYYILDSIMDKKYSVMDIGAGTCGVYQDLKKVKKLIAVDGSKKMLDEAKKLLDSCSFKKVFVNKLYNEYFKYEEKVDVLRLGVYGSYLPLTKNIINHSLSFIKEGGISA